MRVAAQRRNAGEGSDPRHRIVRQDIAHHLDGAVHGIPDHALELATGSALTPEGDAQLP